MIVVKRGIIKLILLSATVLAGCGRSSTGVTDSRTTTAAAVAPVNLPAEIVRAQSENKLLLLEFGSSDSCPPCVIFQKKVFSKPEFLAYEKSNLVFVQIDFPWKTDLPPQVLATNNTLAKQFDVPGYPTFIAVDGTGKEFWRLPEKDTSPTEVNFEKIFDPTEFIALLEDVKKKKK